MAAEKSKKTETVRIIGFVMAGLVPAIHAFQTEDNSKTWMPGTRFTPGPAKPDPGAGHDAVNKSRRIVGPCLVILRGSALRASHLRMTDLDSQAQKIILSCLAAKSSS